MNEKSKYFLQWKVLQYKSDEPATDCHGQKWYPWFTVIYNPANEEILSVELTNHYPTDATYKKAFEKALEYANALPMSIDLSESIYNGLLERGNPYPVKLFKKTLRDIMNNAAPIPTHGKFL